MSLYSFIDLKVMFNNYDKDGDGRISKREWVMMIQCFNLSRSKDQIDAVFMDIDKGGMYT